MPRISKSKGGLVAPIDVVNLADGSVSNTEFQYLDGVTSAIQGQINGKSDTSHTHNATDINAGTLNDSRLSSNVTKEGNTFNGASQLVKLDASSKLPAVDGSALTNLAGGGGTVQDPTTKAIKVAEEVGTTGNARGTNAVDLQVKRSSASQVASGTGSFQAGENCTASGVNSTASGRSSTASGNYSTASGNGSTASGQFSTASGFGSTAYLDGQFSQSSQRITSSGDSQYSFFVVRERTTNATPIVMTLGADGSSTVRAVLPSGNSWRFVIELVAKDTSKGDTFAATYVGAIKRVGSTTSLIGTVTERDKVNDAGASTWSVAVTADDTYESLKIEVTGEASKTIHWCAVVHLTEVA